jgi:NADH-quinone oxidoreductase subunit J
VKAVGRILFTQYLLPFEATSLLLLVSIVGAVVVAKQRI